MNTDNPAKVVGLSDISYMSRNISTRDHLPLLHEELLSLCCDEPDEPDEPVHLKAFDKDIQDSLIVFQSDNICAFVYSLPSVLKTLCQYPFWILAFLTVNHLIYYQAVLKIFHGSLRKTRGIFEDP